MRARDSETVGRSRGRARLGAWASGASARPSGETARRLLKATLTGGPGVAAREEARTSRSGDSAEARAERSGGSAALGRGARGRPRRKEEKKEQAGPTGREEGEKGRKDSAQGEK